MTNFKVISAGWNCPAQITQTLHSVEYQHHQDWNVHIVDDGSPAPQPEMIKAWCDERDSRWSYTLNPTNLGAVRSQYEGIRAMDPQDEDVIVFLDLDGDKLAHPRVLRRLERVYADGQTLLTYGGFRPIVNDYQPSPVKPFPPEVVAARSYRAYIRDAHGTCFNHLRTVKWKVLKQIPESYYQWPNGEWCLAATDYIVMLGCLEIANGRYQCFENELLLWYNDAQPYPDNVRHPAESVRCSMYALVLPPLPAGEF